MFPQTCFGTVCAVWAPKKICPNNISTFLRSTFSTFLEVEAESAFSSDLGLSKSKKIFPSVPTMSGGGEGGGEGGGRGVTNLKFMVTRVNRIPKYTRVSNLKSAYENFYMNFKKSAPICHFLTM